MSTTSTVTPRLASQNGTGVYALFQSPTAVNGTKVSLSVVSGGDGKSPISKYTVRIEPSNGGTSMPPTTAALRDALESAHAEHRRILLNGMATDEVKKSWARTVSSIVSEATDDSNNKLYTVDAVEYRDIQGLYRQV